MRIPEQKVDTSFRIGRIFSWIFFCFLTSSGFGTIQPYLTNTGIIGTAS